MMIINQDDNIAKQYKKVWKKFHMLKKRAYEEIAIRRP